ncbi:hypothetical protein B0H19DRAFT_1270406 [Mycena capillaripes]|nr:hypothetical protein B0H19DRAFT_1270406 [Mycena capillaripes]
MLNAPSEIVDDQGDPSGIEMEGLEEDDFDAGPVTGTPVRATSVCAALSPRTRTRLVSTRLGQASSPHLLPRSREPLPRRLLRHEQRRLSTSLDRASCRRPTAIASRVGSGTRASVSAHTTLATVPKPVGASAGSDVRPRHGTSTCTRLDSELCLHLHLRTTPLLALVRAPRLAPTPTPAPLHLDLGHQLTPGCRRSALHTSSYSPLPLLRAGRHHAADLCPSTCALRLPHIARFVCTPLALTARLRGAPIETHPPSLPLSSHRNE